VTNQGLRNPARQQGEQPSRQLLQAEQVRSHADPYGAGVIPGFPLSMTYVSTARAIVVPILRAL
jgi:hypothetical protein